MGGGRKCVDLGWQATHEIQKPQAEVRDSLEFTGTGGKGNTRFLSSVKSERIKPGASRSMKDREAPADIWVELQLFITGPKSKYHCYFQAVVAFSWGLVIIRPPPSFTVTQRTTSFYPWSCMIPLGPGVQIGIDWKVRWPWYKVTPTAVEMLQSQFCCLSSPWKSPLSRHRAALGSLSPCTGRYFQCCFRGTELGQAVSLANATFMWSSVSAFKKDPFLDFAINYCGFS